MVMETSTAELIKNFTGSVVRWLLVIIGTFLVKKGVVTNEQSGLYVEQATPVVVGVALDLIALGWSLYQKKRANKKIDTALEMVAGTSREKLETAVNQK